MFTEAGKCQTKYKRVARKYYKKRLCNNHCYQKVKLQWSLTQFHDGQCWMIGKRKEFSIYWTEKARIDCGYSLEKLQVHPGIETLPAQAERFCSLYFKELHSVNETRIRCLDQVGSLGSTNFPKQWFQVNLEEKFSFIITSFSRNCTQWIFFPLLNENLIHYHDDETLPSQYRRHWNTKVFTQYSLRKAKHVIEGSNPGLAEDFSISSVSIWERCCLLCFFHVAFECTWGAYSGI